MFISVQVPAQPSPSPGLSPCLSSNLSPSPLPSPGPVMVPFLVSDLTNSDHSMSWHILHCSVGGPRYNVIVMHCATRTLLYLETQVCYYRN